MLIFRAMRFLIFRASAFSFFVTILSLCSSSLNAATYFVSSTGNDSNSGLSLATAWQTITKVNAINFAGGDTILFEAGKTFSGKIYLDSADLGNATNAITVSSFGAGRATISGGTNGGFFAYNSAHYGGNP